MHPHDNEPLVSVIIPAYNAASRIAETLRSVVAQDYPNIEIIVVNDCSSDETPEIARGVLEASGRDHKIIEHEVNRGVSAARNTGMDAASGTFITFFDADDLADVDHISSLTTAITNDDADIAFCGFREIDHSTGNITKHHPVKQRGHITDPEMLVVDWFDRKLDSGLWCMMYRKDFIDKIDLHFTEGCRMGEDLEFLLKALVRSRRTAVSNKMSYIYVTHPKQTSRAQTDPSRALDLFFDDMRHRERVARYFRIHARSGQVKRLTRCLYIPETLIKRFTFFARTKDRARYDELADDLRRHRKLRAILRSTICVLFQDFGLVFKAMLLLISPRAYFRWRSR